MPDITVETTIHYFHYKSASETRGFQWIRLITYPFPCGFGLAIFHVKPQMPLFHKYLKLELRMIQLKIYKNQTVKIIITVVHCFLPNEHLQIYL